eukprot:2626544-Rhodomonas_salina.1
MRCPVLTSVCLAHLPSHIGLRVRYEMTDTDFAYFATSFPTKIGLSLRQKPPTAHPGTKRALSGMIT